MSDCNEALRLNNRYVKALERRARVQRKAASNGSSDLTKSLESSSNSTTSAESTVTQDTVDKLRMALEDMTAVCILEGFQKQEHLMLVDSILKELGKSIFTFLLYRDGHHLKEYLEAPLFNKFM